VACPYVHSTAAFTEYGGKKKRIRSALSFRAALEIVRVGKFLLLLTVGAIQHK